MNTEEVVAMIDAITEGENYNLTIDGAKQTGIVEIQFTPSRFYVKLTEGWGTEHVNPRTAREIAGALVAWANRKEGKSNAHGGLKLGLSSELNPTTSIPEELKHYGELGGTKRVGNSTYADWYRRNVKTMSQETKDRNLKDLRGIWEAGASTATTPTKMSKEEAADIQAAIEILIDAGAK